MFCCALFTQHAGPGVFYTYQIQGAAPPPRLARGQTSTDDVIGHGSHRVIGSPGSNDRRG